MKRLLSVATPGARYRRDERHRQRYRRFGWIPDLAGEVEDMVAGLLSEYAGLLERMPIPPPPVAVAVDSTPGRHVAAGAVSTPFCACSDEPAGARDTATLALLTAAVYAAARPGPLLLDDDDGRVTIRSGKGRKDRAVFCPAGGREAIETWIGRRGSWPGALLSPCARAAKSNNAR